MGSLITLVHHDKNDSVKLSAVQTLGQLVFCKPEMITKHWKEIFQTVRDCAKVQADEDLMLELLSLLRVVFNNSTVYCGYMEDDFGSVMEFVKEISHHKNFRISACGVKVLGNFMAVLRG